MRRTVALLLTTFCLTLLSACLGPQYQMDYQYFPPVKDSGQSCTNGCLLTRTNCELACTTQQAQCEQRAQLRDAMDDFSYRGGYWQNGYSVSAYRPYGFGGQRADTLCRPDACLGVCRDTYHQCYTECGGKVTQRIQCIAHCPVTGASAAPVPVAPSHGGRDAP